MIHFLCIWISDSSDQDLKFHAVTSTNNDNLAIFVLPKKVVFIKNNLDGLNVGMCFVLRCAWHDFQAVTFLAQGVISQEGLDAFFVLWYISSKPSIRDSPYLSLEVTRSSWVNCALRDEEAMYWVSVAHYEAVAVGN